MKRYIITSIVCLTAFGYLSRANSDDLNTVVNVTGTYEASLESRVMPTIPVFIPDSAKVFNISVNYDFLESEYCGTGVPAQFLTDMEISPVAGKKPSTLYVSGALGYRLAPELDLNWCPAIENSRWKAGFFVHNDSYIGPYWSFDSLTPSGKAFTGYDVHTRGGAGFSYSWHSGITGAQIDLDSFIVGCDSLSSPALPRRGTKLGVNCFVKSRHDFDHKLIYDISLSFNSFFDRFFNMYDAVVERNLKLKASLGGMVNEGNSLMVDASAEYASCSNRLYSRALAFEAAPHYVHTGEFWNLSLGLKVAVTGKNTGNPDLQIPYSTKGQIVYPDVHAGVYLFHKTACATAYVGGGISPVTWYSLVRDNHWADIAFSGQNTVLDYEMCRVNTGIDFRGKVNTKFFYGLSAGYSLMGNSPVESVTADGTRPVIAWGGYNKVHAAVNAGWLWNGLDISARFKYTWTDIDFALRLPDFEAGLKAKYTYYKRVSAWVGADWVSSRKGLGMTLPGYVDVYAGAEYKYSGRLSFFLRGDNLAAMAEQIHPLIARKGISVMIGATFSL